MINKIIKERQRSMNAAPTRPSNKSQRQGAQGDPKQKQGRAQGRARTGKPPPKKTFRRFQLSQEIANKYYIIMQI
jgi:hypothetical protein